MPIRNLTLASASRLFAIKNYISTVWTNLNLWLFPDSIEIASIEGLMFCCPKINQSKQLLA